MAGVFWTSVDKIKAINLQPKNYICTRIMVSQGMVSKSKYWISEKIRVCQCLFNGIFKGIFQSKYSYFHVMYCKGMVSKSKYWISENNKGDEYSKTPKNPYILSTGFVSGTLRNHNACI